MYRVVLRSDWPVLSSVLAAVVTLAGCGSGSTPATEPDPVDPAPAGDVVGRPEMADGPPSQSADADSDPGDAAPSGMALSFPSPTTEVPDVPELAPVIVRDSALPGCDTSETIAFFGACERLEPVAWRSSGTGDPSLGADGSACTDWNSGGFPPQALELDLGRDRDLHGLVLIAEMTPPRAEVHHVIEISSAGEALEPVFHTRAVMGTQIPAALVFPLTIRARFVRIRTVESPSWVAWREVVPFVCEGGAVIPPGAAKSIAGIPGPEPPPLKLLKGRGKCKKDADCVPDQCCMPSRCIDKQRAPRCKNKLCPRGCGPMDCNRGGHCVCHQGRCASMIPDQTQTDGVLEEALSASGDDR